MKFTCQFFIPYLVALALGVRLTSSDIIVVISLTCFLNLITTFIPIPGSSGGAEFFFTLLFLPLLGSDTLVTSTMILWRLITFYIPLTYSGLTTLIYNKRSSISGSDYVPDSYMWLFYHNIKEEYSLMSDEDEDAGYY